MGPPFVFTFILPVGTFPKYKLDAGEPVAVFLTEQVVAPHEFGSLKKNVGFVFTS